MNLKEIKEVIQLMNENNLNEIELEKDGLKIRLVRGYKPAMQGVQEMSAESISTAITSALEGKAQAQPVQEPKGNYIQIKSPMVGTFYKSPSPEASSFVEAGDTINPGDIICIIEAMKLMNEIKAEVKGKIKEILVENGEPVEFGQPLFLIEPD